MLRPLDEDIWIADASLRFGGIEVGARMTVVRLPDGRILLHSPIAASDALVGGIEKLGPVAFLVAPNRVHHLYVAEWTRACPDAALFVAPGLDTKRPDLAIAGVLGDSPEPGWAAVLDQVVLRGIPFTNEVVFFHRPTATLIATDLAFNVGPSSPFATRLFFHLLRTYDRLSPTFLERFLVRDRPAFRAALERILAWPFERVVVAHGDVKEHGGRAELEAGYGWVLDSRKAA